MRRFFHILVPLLAVGARSVAAQGQSGDTATLAPMVITATKIPVAGTA